MTNIARNLTRLGLSINEAKVLESLFSMGPLGASDLHFHSGVPRNKAYEVLEGLAASGIVEVQPGRPTLYRVSDPDSVVERLMDVHRSAGEEIREELAALRISKPDRDDGSAYAWVVKGRNAVRRKLAELIYSADSDIFMIAGFPSDYMKHVLSALKAASQRGVHTRAVCMVRPMESLRDDMDNRNTLEYRTVKPFWEEGQLDRHDMKMIEGFRDTSRSGGVAIIDETVAFNMVDELSGAEKVTGILIRAPGAPRIQKGTIERILSQYTRKL